MEPSAIPRSSIERIERVAGAVPPVWLHVSVGAQRLTIVRDGAPAKSYPVSTSRTGTGNRRDSGLTPLGVHRIAARIGQGAPPGRIFRDRMDTGEDWHPADGPRENLVLTRILWLEGLEEGVNRGEGIDTFGRYIYIHGTGREHLVGSPASQGCVTMTNADVIDLFDRVAEGTLVCID